MTGTFAERLADVRARVDAAGGADVRIVAVTKGFGVAAVQQALAAGLVDVGENYAQELAAKASELGDLDPAARPSWHFLGRIQRRRIALVAGLVQRWHGVDRPEVGDALARHAPGVAVLVQVSAWGEPQKGGVEPGEVAPLVDHLRGLGLAVDGLMAVAPAGDPDVARRGFARVRRLADGLDLPECSMGMSDDFEAAVAEGATMIRLGRVLFGPRAAAVHVGN